MKRIFLTSGLVLCMACPAFADLTAPTEQYPNGTVEGTSNPVETPFCTKPTLKGYSGTSTFTAKWTKTFKTITLNINEGTTAGTGGLSGEKFDPTPLYSVPSDLHVWTGLDANENLTGGTNNAGYAADGDGFLLTVPAHGISVNYTLNYNGGSAGTATSTGDYRPFIGVYDQTGTTPYITTDGVLTTQGAAAAAANANGTTWYAKYGTVTPTVEGTPTRDGYTFVGWNTNQSATEALQTQSFPAIADNGTTLYAIWNADSFTITYECPKPTGASTNPTSPTTSSQTIKMDATYTLAGDNNCRLDGYTFAGWSCPSLPGTPTLPAGAQTATYFAAGATGTYSYANDVTCTAQWTPNTINLVWDNDHATSGGTGGGETCTFDGNITLPTTPERTGYEFGGWEVVSSEATQQSGGDNEEPQD